MATARAPQLNIRSAFARERATELAVAMGVTTTEVVEQALRVFRPPPPEVLPDGVRREGWLLVLSNGGHQITLDDVNAAIDADRNGERD